MKRILLALPFILATTFSFGISAKPEKCPGLPALQRVGITSVTSATDQEQNSPWLAFSKDQYDTSEIWVLRLVVPLANNAVEAKDIATKSLNSLAFLWGPRFSSTGGVWYCEYRSPIGNAETATPYAFH